MFITDVCLIRSDDVATYRLYQPCTGTSLELWTSTQIFLEWFCRVDSDIPSPIEDFPTHMSAYKQNAVHLPMTLNTYGMFDRFLVLIIYMTCFVLFTVLTLSMNLAVSQVYQMSLYYSLFHTAFDVFRLFRLVSTLPYVLRVWYMFSTVSKGAFCLLHMLAVCRYLCVIKQCV